VKFERKKCLEQLRWHCTIANDEKSKEKVDKPIRNDNAQSFSVDSISMESIACDFVEITFECSK
jgi:hypothetical protein